MKSLLIIRFFVNKTKKQLAAIVLLLLLASMIMNLWMMLTGDYRKNFAREMDRLNGEDVILEMACRVPGDYKDEIEDVLDKQKHVIDYEVTETIAGISIGPYKDGELSTVYTFFPVDIAENKRIGRYEILERSLGSGAYIPYIYKVNNIVDIGDEFWLKYGDKIYSWTVRGFYSNMTSGTINCRCVPILLTDDCYEEMKDSECYDSYKIAAVTDIPERGEYNEADLIAVINEEIPELKAFLNTSQQRIEDVRYTTVSLYIGIMSLAAGIVIIVLMSVLVISISNYIRENIRNLGILKSLGYVSYDMMVPITFLMGMTAIIISFIGCALSYAIFPILNTTLEKQSGIPYKIGFLPEPMLITVGSIFVIVVICVILSLASIKTVQPIMAIRGKESKGTRSHTLPLEKTNLPVNVALALKSAIAGMKSNIVIFCTMLLVSLMVGFTCFSTQYIIKDQTKFMILVFGIRPDAMIQVSEENEDSLLSYLDDNDDVEEVMLFTSKPIVHDGGYCLITTTIDENSLKEFDQLIVRGSMPRTEKEVAIACYYYEKMGLELGDSFTLTEGGNEATYKICGVIQYANSAGRAAFLTKDGVERLNPLGEITYAMNLKEGTDIDAFLAKAEDDIDTLSTTNYKAVMSALSGTFTDALKYMGVIVALICLGITVLVLYILISISMENKKREYGIYKALGYVTGQLVFQTAFGLMPACIIAVTIGMIISRKGIGIFLSRILRSVGLWDFAYPVSTWLLIAGGLAVVLISFAIACIMAMKIKKIVPHDLFNRE